MSETKQQQVVEIFREWIGCQKCALGELREKKSKATDGKCGHIVFGDGNVEADLVIIGIGPGEGEDQTGQPFVGESGGIINEYLEAVKLPREDVFLMNIVGCRPFSNVLDFKTNRKKEENRDPSQAERDACRLLWQETLYAIDPLLVVAMGKPAVAEVTSIRAPSMRDVNGTIMTCTIPGKVLPVTYPVLSMYHPAFLARSGDTFKGGPWHQALVAWRRAIFYLDQLREYYFGTQMPDRGFKEADLFVQKGGVQ